MPNRLSTDIHNGSQTVTQTPATALEPSRREFLAGMGGAAVVAAFSGTGAFAQAADTLNVARVAVPSSRSLMSENKISALNDGFTPADSYDRTHALYTLWANRSSGEHQSWVQYEWSEPIEVNKVDVYWAVDHPRAGVIPGSAWPTTQPPQSCRVLYWNGSEFVPVSQPQGLGVAPDTFNTTTFEPVRTSKMRLEVVPQPDRPAGILEWRVFNHGPAPALPPVVEAGVDRSVVSNGKTYLSGKVAWLQDSPRN